MIQNLLSNLWQVLMISLSGWIHLFRQAFVFMLNYFGNKTILEKTMAVLLFCQMVSSGMHWFTYQIQFFETPEVVSISSKWNFFFIICSVLCFFWMVFWTSPWVKNAFLIVQTMQILFLLIGFWNPAWVFTDLIKRTDYTFSFPFSVFVLSLVVSTLLTVIQKNKESKV